MKGSHKKNQIRKKLNRSTKQASPDYRPQYNDQDYRGRLHSSPQNFDTQGQFNGGISDNYNIDANDFDNDYMDTYWMGKQYPQSMRTLGEANSSRFYGEHSGKGPKGYKRSDERIREEVCETLTRSPSVDASDIEVEVQEGCVHLKGTVNTRHLKRLAETCIENVAGIDDIQNELRVKKTIEPYSYSSQADGVKSAEEPKEEDTNNSSYS